MMNDRYCGAPETWFGHIVELEVKRAMKMKRLLISAAALISFASVAQAEEPKASRSDIMAAYRSLTREEAKVIRRELAKLSRDEREALSRAYAGYSRAKIRDAMRGFAAPRVYAARSVKTEMPQLLR
jgi:hypothetical protein